MKVFISHKQEDSSVAQAIHGALQRKGISAYLDLIDNVIGAMSSPEVLTQHILDQLSKCTHVIPVISDVTQRSWWVPFEIGVGTDRGLAIASYVLGTIQLPEFLQRWPRLTSLADVEKYAELARSRSYEFADFERKVVSTKRSSSRSFELALKQRLGQS